MCCFALTFQFLRSQWRERRPVRLLLHAHCSVLLCFCVFFLLFGTSSSPSLPIFLFCKHRPRPPRRRLLRLRLGTSPLLVFFFFFFTQVAFFMTSTGRIFYLFPNSTVHLPSSSSSSSSSSSCSFFLFTQAPLFTISTGRIFICSRIRQFSSPPVVVLLLT